MNPFSWLEISENSKNKQFLILNSFMHFTNTRLLDLVQMTKSLRYLIFLGELK
ncbi:hypothetical protein HK096_003041 [Nowakowskiella sp. JEL0078]|nr:hypothetical protein HK096_003041 [Nowakowskiella sp. JEL0078]